MLEPPGGTGAKAYFLRQIQHFEPAKGYQLNSSAK